MVRNTLKLTKVGGLAVAAFALLSPIQNITNVSAVDGITSGCKTQNGVTECVETRNFQIDVQEILDVSVSSPVEYDGGSLTDLLIKKISLSVSSNNVAGFLATMTSNANTTSLVHKSDNSKTIPTLANSANISNFPRGYWGWGRTNYNGTAPTQYNPIAVKGSADAPVLSTGEAGSAAEDIYFGARSDDNTVAGTYAQTILISVVSGVHDNPFADTPTYPEGPSASPSQPGPDVVAGTNGGSGNRYNYGSTSSSDTDQSTTNKDTSNSSSYNGYAYPQGETNTVATVNEGTPLATGLAITACIAAIFGIFFFILLFKRRKDEDEEEQY